MTESDEEYFTAQENSSDDDFVFSQNLVAEEFHTIKSRDGTLWILPTEPNKPIANKSHHGDHSRSTNLRLVDTTDNCVSDK